MEITYLLYAFIIMLFINTKYTNNISYIKCFGYVISYCIRFSYVTLYNIISTLYNIILVILYYIVFCSAYIFYSIKKINYIIICLYKEFIKNNKETPKLAMPIIICMFVIVLIFRNIYILVRKFR
jgi:hypothetical protein